MLKKLIAYLKNRRLYKIRIIVFNKTAGINGEIPELKEIDELVKYIDSGIIESKD